LSRRFSEVSSRIMEFRKYTLCGLLPKKAVRSFLLSAGRVR
jgi:hypothetical protein